MAGDMGLTPKQQRFVDEYLADPELNATAAYRRAYPKCKSDAAAGAAAARLLGTVRVKEVVAAAVVARNKRVEIDQDFVLAGLRGEAEYRGEGASHSARVQAYHLLGKHVGMFGDKLKIEGSARLVLIEEIVGGDGPADGPAPPVAG